MDGITTIDAGDEARDADGAPRPGPTAQLARFVAAPPPVDDFARHAAVRHLIDTLGAMVAGGPQAATRAVVEALRMAGVPEGPVPVPGLRERFDALHAAHVAGTACHGLELDDGYRPGSVHPGTVVVPAAVALSAIRGEGGEALLRAVVAGYEATCRIAAAIHPRSRWRSFHNTGIAGVFGAAAAAASLLRFDAGEVENALGIAASGAAGLFSFAAGGDVKRTHPGHAAREGLSAALATRAGLAGPRGVLEWRDGFLHAFAGLGDEGTPDPAALDLLATGDDHPRSRFAVANCYMKPHACCRHIHAAIDAVLDIAAAEGLGPDAVEAVEVGTYAVAASHAAIGWGEMTEAQMSFPFCVAAALRHGRVGLEAFGEAARRDPVTAGLAARIRVGVDQECERDYPRKRAAKVVLTARDGRRSERYVPEPYGAASNPLSDAALEDKFLSLTAPGLGEVRARAALARLWALADEPDVRPLMQALTPE